MDRINPTKKSQEKLAKEINLCNISEFTQDWECEVVDVNRIEDFIIYYNENILNQNEKITLLRLILESYNDYVSIWGYNVHYSVEIEQIILKDYILFSDLVNDWSCDDDDLEDCFAISLFMRKIKEKV